MLTEIRPDGEVHGGLRTQGRPRSNPPMDSVLQQREERRWTPEVSPPDRKGMAFLSTRSVKGTGGETGGTDGET